MASALMEAEEPSISSDDNRITGLEAQILNSQEVIVRLNRELDSSLLRISTLENICTENQNDLHEKRTRLKRLNDELNEREELNERLNQELNEKNDFINQFKQDDEDISVDDLQSQIRFDRELRQLMLYELDDENNSANRSPQEILDQYRNNERVKFHDLLQESLVTEDISNLIDSEDILFKLLTQLNSLNRLKETLSRDSKQLNHIRSLLHLTTDDNIDEILNDLISKRQCIEYLNSKVDNNQHLNDFDLIKYVLHNYFNFQQQQIDLKEYLQLNDDNDNDSNYSKLLIERHNETIHDQQELNERIKNQEQTIEQLHNQLNDITQRNKQIDELLSRFSTEEINENSRLDRIQAILQSNMDSQEKVPSEREIDELTKEINELREQANRRKNQLKEIIDADDEETQFNLLRSFSNFRRSVSERLRISNDDDQSILQRIDDCQLIVNALRSEENETTEELINKIETMKTAETMVEDLQQRLDESIDNEKQLQTDIKQIADEFAPQTDENEDSDVTRIQQVLRSLSNFREQLSAKTQTSTDEEIFELFEKSQDKQDNNEFYIQIKELLGIGDNQPDEIINKIKELIENSKKINDEYENIRNLLNIENENFQQLNEEYKKLVEKENSTNKSIERLMNKIGLSSIEEIDTTFDKFLIDYRQLTSADSEKMNLPEIFEHIQSVLEENNQLKELIDQIDLDQSSENLDHVSKLQTYLAKVNNLCELISNDNVNIDQVLIIYKRKLEHDNEINGENESVSNFKQQLLKRLAIDNEEQIFDRLNEIEHINNDSANTLTSLNATVAEQRTKILEYEDTAEKLRTQRERMLNKMREMKNNNETLANQVKQANESINEYHRKEIDYKNRIEELAQQLRITKNQIQVTLDECRTQQDLQETMKFEVESLKNEMETQKKLYENRCRQIINEKKQLDKNTKEFSEQKQIVEDENKRLLNILNTIKDTLENVDDIHSIVDTIIKLREDHLKEINILHKQNDELLKENEKFLLNINQQENLIDEYVKMKINFEKRLIDNEQQMIDLKKESEENNDKYQVLFNEYQLYKENNNQLKTNSQVAVINIEQSPPPVQPHLLAVQQAADSNNWMTIDMKDEETPLTTTHRHSTIDTPHVLFNLLGELKSKLGITLTHRPRSSSVFFLYLCAVHLLTIYLLFIRRC